METPDYTTATLSSSAISKETSLRPTQTFHQSSKHVTDPVKKLPNCVIGIIVAATMVFSMIVVAITVFLLRRKILRRAALDKERKKAAKTTQAAKATQATTEQGEESKACGPSVKKAIVSSETCSDAILWARSVDDDMAIEQCRDPETAQYLDCLFSRPAA